MISSFRLAIAVCLGFAGAAHATEVPDPPRIVTVHLGDTLGGLLTEAGIDAGEAHAAIAALTPIFAPRSLAPGQDITLRVNDDNLLQSLEIETSPFRTVALRRQGTTFLAEEQITPRLRHLARIEAPIAGGVFPTLVRAGLPGALAQGLIRALSHEVDFQRDIQPGDRIAVAFERLRDRDGDLLGHGKVHYAALTLSGRVLEVWRHADAAGDVAWFRGDGRPLAGGFLRTPLDGARLTSGFGFRRHPVLGYSRRHEGLDFGAPSGTPIYAASDAVVESLKFERGYGRIVRLRHAGGVQTFYAHMSRFAPGLRPGQRVRQGAVIGAVGSTGMSTGPHLHYEIRIAGRAQNPASVTLPAADPLRGQALIAFQDQQRQLAQHMAMLAAGRAEVALAPD